MNIGTLLIEYCPKCDNLTIHEYIGDEDDIFDDAIQCKNCRIIWEADIKEREKKES